MSNWTRSTSRHGLEKPVGEPKNHPIKLDYVPDNLISLFIAKLVRRP